MKYIIKCPYCGTTYTVDVKQQKQTFMCKSCGAQNSIEDALEKVEEPVTREQVLTEEEIRKERLRKLREQEDAKRDAENVLDYVPMSARIEDAKEEISSFAPILYAIFVIFILFCSLVMNIEEKEEAKRIEQEKKEQTEKWIKDNRWRYTTVYTIDDTISIALPYDIDSTEDENVFITTDGKVTYRIQSFSALGGLTPEEAYNEQLGIYIEQEGLLSYSEELESVRMADYSWAYVGCIHMLEAGRKFDYEVLIVPHRNMVVTLSMEYAEGDVPEDDIRKLTKAIVVLAGSEDVATGKILTEADGSKLVLSEDGTYTHYQFKDVATGVYASGNYEVCYGQTAIDKLVTMTNYGFTERALQDSISENMKGYVLNGEVSEGTEESLENVAMHHVCQDTFYVLILHQEQVSDGENITTMNQDILYTGYYVSELNLLDLSNADTKESVQFMTPDGTTNTYNIYDREMQIQDIYLDSSKGIYCQEGNPYQDKLLLQFELVAQKETISATGFEFNRTFGFTTFDNGEIEFLEDATEGIYRIHIANSDGSQRDYYYKEDEDIVNLCTLVNKALDYENERNR